MIKKTLLAAALAVTALGVSAHQSTRNHYHNDDGTVTYSNVIRPTTVTTYETDRQGRRIRVDTTTSCADTRLNPRNRHLRCLEEVISTRRTIVDTPNDRPSIAPVVYRSVERDGYRRVIVTTTYTCSDARWSPDRSQALCFDWDVKVDREVVRRQPRSNSMDLNGDGRTDGWERLVFEGFRDVLDNEH